MYEYTLCSPSIDFIWEVDVWDEERDQWKEWGFLVSILLLIVERLFADIQGCFSAGSKAQEWEKMQFFSTALHLLPFTFCQALCLLSENWFFTVKNTIKATQEMLWTIFSIQHLVSVEPSCWQMWVTRGRLSCDVYSSALTLRSSHQAMLWLYTPMKNNTV